MQPLTFRDEKLYRISVNDYGDPLGRACGIILYSLTKGIVVAIGVALVFTPPLKEFGRHTYEFLLALALACAVGVAFLDRRVFVCEIEIFSDRIVRHSGDKTLGIGLADVQTIKEGTAWTMFGLVNGLSIRSKKSTIFIPAGCPDYVEIKSKLGAWRPAFD